MAELLTLSIHFRRRKSLHGDPSALWFEHVEALLHLEESPRTTLGPFWWSWLRNSSPHPFSCSCYVPHRSTEDTLSSNSPCAAGLVFFFFACQLWKGRIGCFLFPVWATGQPWISCTVFRHRWARMMLLSFCCTFFYASSPPPVRAALANSPCLAAGNFWGLAEEADQVLLSSRCFSDHNVASDTVQPSATDADMTLAAGEIALPAEVSRRARPPARTPDVFPSAVSSNKSPLFVIILKSHWTWPLCKDGILKSEMEFVFVCLHSVLFSKQGRTSRFFG